MFSVWRLAYRLGSAVKRHAELHNRRFLGIFPDYLSQLFLRGILDAPYLWFLATDSVPLSGRTAIGHVADKQPKRSGRNLVSAFNRNSASGHQDTDKTDHVCEDLVVMAK